MSQSRMMRAACIMKPGGPEAIQILQLPTPQLSADHVLLELHASSVNPIDVKVRSGYVAPFLLKKPKVLGGDAAGVVIQAGRDSKFKPGDRVFGHLNTPASWSKSGTYAEYVAANASCLAKLPAEVLFEEAGAIPTVGLTAWQALLPDSIQPGQRILIHAGAGGVGHIAVQLAKRRGAYVIVTARNAYSDFVKGLGADEVLDYSQGPWEHALYADPVDLVVDSVGGDYRARSLQILKRRGRYAHILSLGYMTHGYSAFPALMRELRDVLAGRMKAALGLGPGYTFVAVHPDATVLSHLGEMMAARTLKVVIDRVFTLQEASAAHQYLEKGKPQGKVSIKIK